MKMESLQQRGEELERKEFQLKESLLKFDKFLKVRCLILFASEYTNKHYKLQNDTKIEVSDIHFYWFYRKMTLKEQEL